MSNFTPPAGVKVAPSAPLYYQPDFWDDRKAYSWYAPDIEGAFLEGYEYGRQHRLLSADDLEAKGVSNTVMITDIQDDFRPAGRLPVQGTDDVVLRLGKRLVNGTVQDYYTRAVFSQDGHSPRHISYGSCWLHETGKPFDLRVHKAAVLSLEDERLGIFRATSFDPATGAPIDMGQVQRMFNVKDSVAYWNHLQQTDQGPIWVFANHCKIGTDGVNLHPLIAEVLAFMEGVRGIEAMPVFKGHLRDTDWFGPLEPCRPDSSHPQGGFQKPIVDLFDGTRGRVEFFGVAEDFCDFNMKKQVMRYFKNTRFFERMAFASDGTAPIVPNALQVLQLNAQARAQGVKFFTHDEPFNAAA